MNRMSRTKRGTHSEEKEKRKKMQVQKVALKMDALAKKLGKWDPQATIRKFRDANLKTES